jgi:putative ABC transport system permease protein
LTSLGLKSLWARKFRAATTVLAVVIGVAFVAGTYILTDTTFAAFDEIFEDSLAKTDVVISARDEVRQESGEIPSFNADLLPKVERVQGVRVAAGQIFTPGGFFDAENEQIGSKFAPKFITSILPEALETQTYTEGRPPQSAAEAALDQDAADEAGLGIGDTLKLASVERVKAYRIVGLTRLGDASWGGASIAGLILPEAQRITGKRGEFDQIAVAADAGVSEATLKQRVQRVVPSSVLVETAKQNAERNSDQIREDIGFLRIALLVFAFVALFVGAFLIFNTFSITVAQRIKEFGMLRTLGASRRQILSSVVIEALAIGVFGALLGLLAGYGIAVGLKALFVAIGIDLPTTALVTKSRTVVVSLLIGIGVTLVSSLIPALRSTRVPPIAALLAIELPHSRRRGVVTAVIAALLGAAGLAMLLAGLFGGADGGAAAGLMGGGAVVIILGVSLFSPRLVRPLASIAGKPLEMIRIRRLTGRLARENTQRNPARTAVTAAALMIGLAVVTFVTVFAAGIKSSIATAVDESFQGELVIQNSDGFSPIPPRIVPAAAKVPGVELVSSLRSAQAKLVDGGGKSRVSSLSRNADAVLNIDWTEGGPETLGRSIDSQVVVDKAFADGNGLAIGDRVRFLTQVGARPALEVVGEFEDKADLLGSAIVTQGLMERQFDQRDDVFDFVKLAPGADAARVQASLVALMKRAFPVAEVRNQQELKENQEEQINQLLSLIYALLALAVIVSLFGIANTLALSIHERTRELGMLRAIGMSRRQVRTMIRYEAVITALIGAILGTVLGVIFAALIAQPLKDEGFTLSYPVGSLIALLVIAAVLGVIAAIPPARRASRLDVLDSLQYE